MGATLSAPEARTRQWGMRQMVQNETVFQEVADPPRTNRPGLATNLVSHNDPKSFLIRPKLFHSCGRASCCRKSFHPAGDPQGRCGTIVATISAASLLQRCRKPVDLFGASSYGVPQNATVCINFGETPGTQLARSNLHSTGFGMLRYDSAVFERTRDPENRHGHIRL